MTSEPDENVESEEVIDHWDIEPLQLKSNH